MKQNQLNLSRLQKRLEFYKLSKSIITLGKISNLQKYNLRIDIAEADHKLVVLTKKK